MELSLRLEIIFRISISEKAIEFIFKVEFEFIFSVFREEKLNGCWESQKASEKYLAKRLTISALLLTTILSKVRDRGSTLLLLQFLINVQKYFGFFYGGLNVVNIIFIIKFSESFAISS